MKCLHCEGRTVIIEDSVHLCEVCKNKYDLELFFELVLMGKEKLISFNIDKEVRNKFLLKETEPYHKVIEKLPCQRCKSNRIMSICGKTSDCFTASYKGKEHDGYVFGDIGLGDDSDYIKFKYCLDCGQIQETFGVNFPIDEQVIQDQFDESQL